MKEVKILVGYDGDNSYEDTDVLLQQLNEEYDKPRSVVLQLIDLEGQVITGRCKSVVGTLENGDFLLVGTVDDVIFIKEEK